MRSVPPTISTVTIPLFLIGRILGEFIPIGEILHMQYYRLSRKLKNKILRAAILSQDISDIKSYLWLNLLCKPVSTADSGISFERALAVPLTEEGISEISRDVVRTMPSHPAFSSASPRGQENQTILFNVLKAVSSAEPSVGYCQGMNFVAATLLINLQMNPEHAFNVFISILRNFHFKNLYSPDVPLLPLRMFMFSRLVRQHVPQVWHHLNSKTFSVEIFANQWIMTLYSYYLDPEILGDKIWTLFFLLGWKFLFIFGLAILSMLQNHILAMDVEDISAFMASTKTIRDGRNVFHPFTDKEKVQSQLEMALLTFRIKNSHLELLAQQFLTEKIIALVEDADLSPGNSRKPFNILSSSGDSMESVDSKQMGFSWLTSKDRQIAFLRINLSFLHTPNRPMEITFEQTVDVPVHALQQMIRTVDMVSRNFFNEINRVSSELKELERKLNAENKHFNSLVANAQQSDVAFNEILAKKQAASASLQEAVLSSNNVADHLRHVSTIEKEFDDKKEERNWLYNIVAAQESKIAQIASQKSDLIVAISSLATKLEFIRHDVIYRSIQSAIASFSSNV